MALQRRISVRDFFRIASLPRGGFIAVLKLALDASKTEIGPGLTAVAGYIGTLEDWEAVEKEWTDAVDRWRLTDRFHLVDLENDVGREKLDLCIGYFCNIIAESNLMAVGSLVADRGWDEIDYKEVPGLIDTRYRLCLNDLLTSLGGRLLESDGSKDIAAQDIAVVCDPDDTDTAIHTIFRDAQARNPALVSLTIVSSKKAVPLQCADLAVGLLRRNWLQFAARRHEDFDASTFWNTVPVGKRSRNISLLGQVNDSTMGYLSVLHRGTKLTINYRTAEGKIARPLHHFANREFRWRLPIRLRWVHEGVRYV